MPAKPRWLPLAIPDAISQLEQLDRPLLTRRDIEWLFGVGKVRAAGLRTTFGAELVGNQRTLPRTKANASRGRRRALRLARRQPSPPGEPGRGRAGAEARSHEGRDTGPRGGLPPDSGPGQDHVVDGAAWPPEAAVWEDSSPFRGHSRSDPRPCILRQPAISRAPGGHDEKPVLGENKSS